MKYTKRNLRFSLGALISIGEERSLLLCALCTAAIIFMAYRILVADDDADIRQLLCLYLEKDHHEVFEAEDGLQALSILKNHDIDLILLDLMMPKVNGYEVLKQVRRDGTIPVIILSAKSTDEDKILGLDLGADDYLAKPFNPLEAMARVNSNLRRCYSLSSKGTALKSLKVRDLTLDQDSCTIKRGDVLIDLTSIEYKIMRLFMEHPGKVFTKQQIFEAGWEESYEVSDNNIMVCISKLRSKLSSDNDEYIRTIRGLGYRLEK